MVDLWRDFWMRETETGQQVAQPHDRYMMMMMMVMILSRHATSTIFLKTYFNIIVLFNFLVLELVAIQ